MNGSLDEFPSVIDIEDVEPVIVPTPTDDEIAKMIAEMLKEEGCMSSLAIKKRLEDSDITIGESRVRNILRSLMREGSVYYNTVMRKYCTIGSAQ
jgi:hypothetical protein